MYLHRNYANLTQRYLEFFPAVCIIGPRQAGKTAFAKNLKSDWQYFDLEEPSDFELITRDPALFFEQYPQIRGDFYPLHFLKKQEHEKSWFFQHYSVAQNVQNKPLNFM